MGGSCPKTVAGNVGTQVILKEIAQDYHPLTQTKEAKEGVEGGMEEEEPVGEEEVQTLSATTTKTETIMCQLRKERKL